jgi:hypothetical protein
MGGRLRVGSHRPSTLEVVAVFDGVEVSVETRVVDGRWTDDVGQRMMVHEHITAASIASLAIASTRDTSLSENPPR